MIQSSPRKLPNGMVLPWPPLPQVYIYWINGILISNTITMEMEDNRDFLPSRCGWDGNLCSPEINRDGFLNFFHLSTVWPCVSWGFLWPGLIYLQSQLPSWTSRVRKGASWWWCWWRTVTPSNCREYICDKGGFLFLSSPACCWGELYQPTRCRTCCRSRSRCGRRPQLRPKPNRQKYNEDEGSSKRDQDTECRHDGVLTKSVRYPTQLYVRTKTTFVITKYVVALSTFEINKFKLIKLINKDNVLIRY